MLEELHTTHRMSKTMQLKLINNTIKDQELPIFHMARKNDLQKLMQSLDLFKFSKGDHVPRILIALAQMVVLMLGDLNSTPRIFGTKQLNSISNTIKDLVLPIFHMARKNDLQKLMLSLDFNKLSKLDHIHRVLTVLVLLVVGKM